MKLSTKNLLSLAVLILIAAPVFVHRMKIGDDAANYFNSARVKFNNGDRDGAFADCSKAIELNKRFIDAYAARGTLELDKGELDRALADFNKVIELKPDVSLAYANRATIEKRRGDWNAAQADYNRSEER